jgi:hypothetical protein
MNTILDTLYLRKPRLDYISPAICEVNFSGSGVPVIIIEPIGKLISPTGGISGGRGAVFFTWKDYPGQLCFTVYYNADPGNVLSPYNIVQQCIPEHSVSVCSAGLWQISANTPSGETAKSSPVSTPGGGYVNLPLPSFPNTISYNLYKNGLLYWYGFNGSAFETCAPGCYKVGAITLDGETPLSDPVCTGMCQTLTCPSGFVFSEELCGCIPCDIAGDFITCDPGFHWSNDQCKCVSGGGGGTILLFGCLHDLFGETVLAPDGFVGPCTFTETGTLPDGILFSVDGPLSASISGVPTQDGVFPFTVDIQDSTDQFATISYKLTTFGFANSDPSEFTVGQFYTFLLQGFGEGTPPIDISISSGTLPNGLNFFPDTPIPGFAEVGGTPTDNIGQDVTFKMTDSSVPPLVCFHTYSFRPSTCPDWSQVVWTPPSSTVGTGTFFFDGGHIEIFADSSLGAHGFVQNGSGDLAYNGPGCNCNLAFNLQSYQNSFGGIKILWNASVLVDTTVFPGYNPGTYNIPFTIPAGPGTIHILPAYHFILGQDYWALSTGFGQPPNNIRYVATITNL